MLFTIPKQPSIKSEGEEVKPITQATDALTPAQPVMGPADVLTQGIGTTEVQGPVDPQREIAPRPTRPEGLAPFGVDPYKLDISENQIREIALEGDQPPALETSRILAREVDLGRERQVKDIAERLDVPEYEAMALLSTLPVEELKMSPQLQKIEEDYPGIVQWAQKPENYKVLSEDPEFFMETESLLGNMTGWMGDAARVGAMNIHSIRQAAIHTAALRGLLSPEKAAVYLERTQEYLDRNPIENYEGGLREILEAFEGFEMTVDKTGERVRGLDNLGIEDRERLFRSIVITLAGSGEAALDVAEIVNVIRKNPGAFLLLSGQSAWSAAPLLGSAIAMKGGPLLAAAAGSVGGFGVAYAQYLMEASERFRNEKTGKIDFVAMYSDPATVADLKDKALKYGGTHAAFGAASGLVLAKTLSKRIEQVRQQSKKLSAAKRIATLGAAASIDVGVQMGLEGAGETLAQLAIGESAEEAIKQGAIETIVSGPFAVGGVAAGSYSRRKFDKKRSAAIQSVVEDATDAVVTVEKYDAIQKMREAWAKSETARNNPQQAQEFIREADAGIRTKPESNIPDVVNVESESRTQEDSEVDRMQREEEIKSEGLEPENSYAELVVTEFEEFALSQEMTPDALAESMGPEFYKIYKDAKQSERGSFEVPLDIYFRFTEKFPEMDSIAYFDGSSKNLIDALGTLEEYQKIELEDFITEEDRDSDIYRSLQTKVQTLVEGVESEGSILPSLDEGPLPSQETSFGIEEGGNLVTGPIDDGVEFIQPEGRPEDTEPVLRPIELLLRTRSKPEQKIFREIRNKLREVARRTGASLEAMDLVAEVAFRNARFRSKVLGRPLEEVAKELALRFDTSLIGNTIAFFNPNTSPTGVPRNAIVFGPNTKLNAVLHEYGHAWLHNMAIDYEYISAIPEDMRTDLQQEYFEAMQAATELLSGANGAPQLNNIGELLGLMASDIRTKGKFEGSAAIHETWAQTTERYFLEGDFSDSRLRKVFEMMRRWMLDIASIVAKAYPQWPAIEPNAQVSRVMNTILDASQLVEDQTERMFPDPMFDPALLGPRREAYRKALKDARDEAIAKMYTKFFNRSLAERERLIERALDAVYDEARAEFDNTDAMRLFYFITEVGGADSRVTQESIQRELLMFNNEYVPPEFYTTLTRRKLVAGKKKKGVDIRDVAKGTGKTIREVMDILIMFATRKDDRIIDDIANRKFEEAFPKFKTDDEIHAAAVEAINNEGREKVIALELQELAQRLPKTLTGIAARVALQAANQPREVLKNLALKAESTVGAASLTVFKPNNYMKASLRYNRKASEALGKGDFDKAFEYKQLEAQAYTEYLYALQAAKKVNRVTARLKHIKKLSPQKASRYHDPDVYGFLKVMQDSFENNRSMPMLDVTNLRNKMVIDINTERMVNTALSAYNLIRREKGLNVKAYLVLGEVLEMLSYASTAAMRVQVQGKEMLVAQAAQTLIDEVGAPTESEKKKVGRQRRFVDRITAPVLSFRGLFASFMSESDLAKSFFTNAIFGEVAKNQAIMMNEKGLDEVRLRDLAIATAKKQPLLRDVMNGITSRVVSTFKGSTEKNIDASLLDHSFNGKSEILQMLLYMGSESGARKFVMGGLQKEDGTVKRLGVINPETGLVDDRLVQQQINEFIEQGILTKEDFDFVQGVWDTYARHYDKLKESVRYIYNRNMGRIDARPIQTPWGEYRGGYVPLKFQNPATAFGTDLTSIVMNNTIFTDEFAPQIDSSMKESRTERYEPLSLDLNTLPSNLNKVYVTAYLAPTMLDVGKIFSNQDLQRAINARRAGAMDDIVIPWLKRVSAQKYSEISDSTLQELSDKAARFTRKRARILMFLGNWSTALVQELGQIQATQVVPLRKILRANAQVHFGNMKRVAEEITTRNPRMKARLENNHRRMAASLTGMDIEGDALSRLDAFVESMTYAPIHYMQTHVDLVVYIAAMDQAREMGMTDQNAIDNYATDVVERTQLSADIASRPDALMGSETKRLFSDLQSVPIALFGLLYESYVRAGMTDTHENRVKVFAVAATLLRIVMVPAIVGTMLRRPGDFARAIGGEDEDETEEFFKDMAANIVSEGRDVTLPVSGRVMWAVFSGIATGRRGDFADITPSVSRLSQTATGVNRTTTKAVEGDDLTIRDISAMLDGITAITGAPTSAINPALRLLRQIDPELE